MRGRGEVYRIEVALFTLSSTSVRLLDEDGERLAFGYVHYPLSSEGALVVLIDDVQDGEWTGYNGSKVSRVGWWAAETGELFVQVSGYRSYTGTYTLTVSVLEVDDDHGNRIADASPVPVGGSVPGAIEYQEDVDFFAFSALEGETYVVDVAQDTLAWGDVWLFGEDGEGVPYGYCTHLGSSRIACQGPDTGMLFARVSVDGGRTGTYTLTVSAQEDDHGNGPATASRVPVGEEVAGAIEYVRDLDFFTFDAREGETYQIDVIPGTLPYAEATLETEDGYHADADYGRPESPGASIVWRAIKTGSLILEVNGGRSTQPPDTGTYTVTVSVLDIEQGGG